MLCNSIFKELSPYIEKPRNDLKIRFRGFSGQFMTSFYWEFSKQNEIFKSRENVLTGQQHIQWYFDTADAILAPKLWLPKKVKSKKIKVCLNLK